MSLLNSAKRREENLTKERNKKCEPVAFEIIQIIARSKPTTEDLKGDWEKAVKIYGPIATEINMLMKEKDLSISEVNYTWSVVQSVLDSIKRLSNDAVQTAFELAEQKLFVVDNCKDVTLKQIDNVLLLR